MHGLTLIYRGPFKPNDDAKTLHELRSRFHPQLRRAFINAVDANRQRCLFRSLAVNGTVSPEIKEIKQGESCLALADLPVANRNRPAKDTAPTVELDILLLRHDLSGSLNAQGAEIDRTSKTLLDALQVPDAEQAKLDLVNLFGSPIFCLMQDDSYVIRKHFSTGPLLGTDEGQDVTVLIVHVTINESGHSERTHNDHK